MREIDAVYRGEAVPSTLWLCKFYALMALGEIYTHRRGVGDSNRVPGTNYYARAVKLLQSQQDVYEKPSLLKVEVFTLLVSHGLFLRDHIPMQQLTRTKGMGIEHFRAN